MSKYILHAFIFAIFVCTIKANAQCDFIPTIKPKEVILCPETSDTLFTERADAYQWYRGDDKIPGATHRYYVTKSKDVGYYIKVASTRNGCTAYSEPRLIDSYFFLLPFFVHSGDLGMYDPKRNATILCPGDTLILTLGNPYNTNVQWYNNGDTIEGANSQKFFVTESGSYTACGAPAVCPNYISCQNLPVNVIFETPTATISERGDTLFASEAKSYQWFLYGKKIPNATAQYYVPRIKGKYMVSTKSRFNCTAFSEPFFFTFKKIALNRKDIKSEVE